MKIINNQDTITKQTLNSNNQKIKLVIGHWLLVIIWLLVMGHWSLAIALGGKPPEKEEEPKYKLEILKMEVITAPSLSYEVKALSSKKVLIIIAPKDFQDQEFSKPKQILEAEGAKIVVASSTAKTATGIYGMKVKPDITLKEAKATDYDAVIFVGGSGATDYADDPQALSLAIEAQKHDKILGAICVAPVILAKAGILEGKKATVSIFGKNELTRAKAIYSGKDIEIDGKIITGKGPAEAEAFGKTIVEALKRQ